MPVSRLKKIAEFMEKSGGGMLHLSVRQPIELSNLDDFNGG
jgi:dissimilatory sulfite reductase (desulfoviridin) alpha/beta subunit